MQMNKQNQIVRKARMEIMMCRSTEHDQGLSSEGVAVSPGTMPTFPHPASFPVSIQGWLL